MAPPVDGTRAQPSLPRLAIPPLERWSSLHSYLLLTTATMLCLLPFSGRAFHVDDTLFVWAAQQIAKHPLDPYGFQLTWGNSPASMADVTQNPPLASYYAALIGRMAGWSERALHVGFLVPTLALVLGTYRLAQRLTHSPLLAALATLLTPGLLVSASSVMCDTMMLAIWVWAVISWVEGLEPARPLLLTAAALLIAAAALTKYFGASLILLFLIYAVAKQRRVGSWALYLLIPVAILLSYQLWSTKFYGHGLLSHAAAFAATQRSFANAPLTSMVLMGVSFTGGCALSALVLAPLVWPRIQTVSGVALSGTAAVAIALEWVPLGLQVGGDPVLAARHQDWLLLAVQLTFCIAGGLSILALAITDYWEERSADSLFLTLWVGGTFFFAAFLNYTLNARSVLPLIPAVGILLARRFDRIPIAHQRPSLAKIAAALMLSGLVSLWVARADAELANSARHAAQMIFERTRGQGGALWFEGHWGFQYYMESRGAHPVDFNDPQAHPGDFIVIPVNNIQLAAIAPQFIASSESFELPLRSGASTICRNLGAGFYSSYWGPLPYAFGPIPPERYVIVRLAQEP